MRCRKAKLYCSHMRMQGLQRLIIVFFLFSFWSTFGLTETFSASSICTCSLLIWKFPECICNFLSRTWNLLLFNRIHWFFGSSVLISSNECFSVALCYFLWFHIVCAVHLDITNISSQISHLGSVEAPILLLQSTANLNWKHIWLNGITDEV